VGSLLIVTVASDDSSFINGTDFMVDGGLHACYVVCRVSGQGNDVTADCIDTIGRASQPTSKGFAPSLSDLMIRASRLKGRNSQYACIYHEMKPLSFTDSNEPTCGGVSANSAEKSALHLA
jgi:hypothetical protein